ncbi:hypothetical protein [Macrococcus lamae]|uniref:hypothetical protein n=1 Tax=Macrococcus lamae TaxID=198484 RepID=UPI001FB71329|nr:hypothetical protein [Macrococcus lamae]
MHLNSKTLKMPLQISAVSLIVIIVSIMLVRELSTIDFRHTIIAFRSMSTRSFVTLILLGLLSVLVLTLYDFALVRALNIKSSLKQTAATSYIINALNNLIGFGGFIGASLRFFTYQPYVSDKKQLSKAITLLLMSM